MNAPRLILASGSRYRAELLARFGLPFETVAPAVDESPLPGEAPAALAARLANAKAEAGAHGQADALVIGSDQVAELDGHPVGKPADLAAAQAQLRAASGRWLLFHTGLTLFDSRDGHHSSIVDCTRVRFRTLAEAEIARYLERERPLDCAGSFKCEGLGISLFERIETVDPTALIGLPLIQLAQLLRQRGVSVP
ncbi:MAG TPA: Maf family nucleotide pyrophosphatase [Rhodanobacteraceae bacterium]|nr:Maf family nucleotide pyrophosphatase [Rhodanobacteraceae bacterium]